MVYYGVMFKSTMCGVESIFLAETEDKAREILSQFKTWLYDEDESFINNYCNDYSLQWDSETSGFTLGKLDNGHHVLISEDGNAYEFIMTEEFIERF